MNTTTSIERLREFVESSLSETDPLRVVLDLQQKLVELVEQHRRELVDMKQAKRSKRLPSRRSAKKDLTIST